MLETYTRRSSHVQQFAERSEHAREMVIDINAYISGLKQAADIRVKIWHIAFDERSDFAVFEGIESGKILGCIYGVDKRKVTESEWEALWGELGNESSN